MKDKPVSVFTAVGATLMRFALDAQAARLEARDSIDLPSRVRYAWPHPVLPILYAACGNGGAGPDEAPWHLCAISRDETDSLCMTGPPVPLPARPIHVTTDRAGRYILTTFSVPSGLSLHTIRPDGRIDREIFAAQMPELGSTAHQARFMPSGDRAIVVGRGMKGHGSDRYIQGRFNVMRCDAEKVAKLHDVTPGNVEAMGGFNPRHIDFHPTLPIFYAVLEGQNRICAFRFAGEEIDPTPLFTCDMLSDRAHLRPRQDAGAIHVHPNGRYVYAANRNDGCVGGHIGPSWLNPDPIPIFPGGENSIAVFSIDPGTGEPMLIQNADTHGLHPRAFSIDPRGEFLVAGNYAPTRLETAAGMVAVPANLALFRIGADGRLTFAHRHDLNVGAEKAWWTGMAAL